MAKKHKLNLHADAHCLQRALMTDSELERINHGIKEWKNKVRASVCPAGEASAANARGENNAPPLVTRGESNQTLELLSENGEIKEVTKRVHYDSKVAIIDWVNTTMHESTFVLINNAVTDKEVYRNVSECLVSIFGFGITAMRDRGANFYHRSLTIGNDWGMVCHGGQANTILITLNGEGCAAARHGWERRLYDFLNSAVLPKITRIDVAHDDFNGDLFTLDSLYASYHLGGFNVGGRNPDIEQRGNWLKPNGKGRTLYIGNRTNGKFLRAYEKGLQLCPNSNQSTASRWVRVEVELKSVDRILPFEILIYPHEYLAATYPVLSSLSVEQERIMTTQKTVELSYDRTKNWLVRQCGSALKMVNEIDGIQGINELFVGSKIPKGMTVPSFKDSAEELHTTEDMHQPAIFQYIGLDL